jgi:dTDP-4-amino-4,6-dideoxy-D-galactose acyltransferase
MNKQELKIRYHQFSVDRNVNKEFILSDLENQFKKAETFISNDNIIFYYSLNLWENDFFDINSINLLYIDYEEFDRIKISLAINHFIKFLKNSYINFQLTFEIPSEDIHLIQLLNSFSFRLIETRLHFVNNNLEGFQQEDCLVRLASKDDIVNLKKIASKMRNEFDRFHADWSYSNDKADKYLEVYIENSINGFCDLVIVPNEDGVASDSFLTANVLKEYWQEINYPISKMILSAVSSETNKGWYFKLISEMTKLLIKHGAKSIFMNTQSTNIAVMVTWQKLGFKIGRSTHILSYKTND